MRTGCAMALCATLLGAQGCTSVLQPQDDLSRRVDYLRADVEKLAQQQEQLLAEVRALRESTPMPSPAPGPSQAAPAPERLTPQAPPSRESGQLSGDPAAVYQRAYDLLSAGRVAESQSAFAGFIRDYPQSDLADNAQYWIGEGFYVQKAFQEARDAFQGVVDHFPFGNKVPDALFKRALCEGELGDKAAERKTLGDLLEQYPFSDASAKARDLLDKLG